MSAVVTPDISGSPDSSDAMLSAFGSSFSPAIDAWCRIDGLLRDRVVWETVFGRTVGDRSRLGGRGVVGDSGWDVMPLLNPGTIDGRRSTSRTGRILNPSAVSIEGTAVASG